MSDLILRAADPGGRDIQPARPQSFAVTARGMVRRVALVVGLGAALAGCTGASGPDAIAQRRALPADLPVMKRFDAAHATPPQRSNTAIAQDFLDLTFQLESGRPIPVMTRFEQPITVSVAPGAPVSLGPDLSALLSRLRREAGIDILPAPAGMQGNIVIQSIPRDDLHGLVPRAACFVVPRVSSWQEYRLLRRTGAADWTTLTRRDQAAIFLPNDVSPQEIRDCLHEELAQALGPLNDLYRLPDSLFNDDNFHAVLTGFDMLILRAYYAPELANGMTRDQVAARLPALLARLNPAGVGRGGPPLRPTPRDWTERIETALGPDITPSQRRAAADQALRIARANGWTDNRMGFTLFAVGRLNLANDPVRALSAFLEAGQIYAVDPVTAIHEAHIAMHLAAFALAAGQPDTALGLINSHLKPAVDAENAALLATMLMVKADALDQLGRPAEAGAVRLDSLGWARYGLGSDREVRARLQEIAALSPKGNIQ